MPRGLGDYPLRLGEPGRDHGPATERRPLHEVTDRMTPQARGLLNHLRRFERAEVLVIDAWAQYASYCDYDRGANGRDLRADFDAALASLHEQGIIEWDREIVRLKA
jgi:hypothetical protein